MHAKLHLFVTLRTIVVRGKPTWGSTRGTASRGAEAGPIACTRKSSAMLLRTASAPCDPSSDATKPRSSAGPASRACRTARDGSSKWKTAADGTK